MESEKSLCFWARADVLGSPDHQIGFFFFVRHTVSVTTILAFIIIIKEEWRKKIFKRVQSPIGYVLNCFEKEVVLFLVFISFQDACLPLCTLLEISL